MIQGLVEVKAATRGSSLSEIQMQELAEIIVFEALQKGGLTALYK